ncbi:MAG TPA: hypothetical protein VGQ37_00480 [Vicinamibacterales bacterium]|jgi:hypothetical protein|nr:hypothetical protein [Vicinamibacterales bacterium]
MRLLPAGLALGVLLAVAASLPVAAHKPITSPYTFAEDVLPILRDRCGACHVQGGPAPMPLTTAEETVPWGESIRLELIAGHMPPWSAMSGGKRLRHAEGLSARELNVLLTWVTGGTPPGDAKPTPAPAAGVEWALGTPDLTLALPETPVAADQGEVTREIVLPLAPAARRPLRAVDLRPGTRSLVRSARIAVRSASHAPDNVEALVGLWVPGDQPVALPAGTAFAVPGDAELVITIRLRKTWEHEREAMSDRSTLALYFADAGARPIAARAVGIAPAPPPPPPGRAPLSPSPVSTGVVTSETLTTDTRILAVYPTTAAAGATITIDATPEGGLLQRVLEFSPQRGWERRYWLDQPLDLPRGTRLQTSVKFERLSSAPTEGAPVILNVVPSVP